jgi:hypothetical protein
MTLKTTEHLGNERRNGKGKVSNGQCKRREELGGGRRSWAVSLQGSISRTSFTCRSLKRGDEMRQKWKRLRKWLRVLSVLSIVQLLILKKPLIDRVKTEIASELFARLRF